MAATNLAVVNDDMIIVYSDAVYGVGWVLARVLVGTNARNHNGYTAALKSAGWALDGSWGWSPTAEGALPAVFVRKA